MTTRKRARTAALAAGLALWTAGALAQPPGGMPDLRTMMGKPLPAANMPAGTITVRVSRQVPMAGVEGVVVSATVAGGQTKSAKTDAQGRATFAGLTPGATFQATTSIDGEQLQTEAFPVPATGGARVLLISGLGAAGEGAPAGAPAAEAPPADPNGFGIDAMVGNVQPRGDLPAGTLDVAVFARDGRPLPSADVMLGEVKGGAGHAQQASDVTVHRGRTDERGVARFTALPTGQASAYAAVAVIEGVRFATRPFAMDAAQGMRGEIRAPASTNDVSTLSLDRGSKLIFVVREDGLEVMQSLVFRNASSDKIYDGRPGGIFVPLPKGHVNAQEIPPKGAPVEIRAPDGVSIEATLPPGQATEARFAFVYPANGDDTVTYEQRMPFAVDGATVLVPESSKLTLTGKALTRKPDDKDTQGRAVQIYELGAIPAGGTLALSVAGIPQSDKSGQKIAGVLALLLVAGALVGARTPPDVQKDARSKEALLARREALFKELVVLEDDRRAGKAVDDRRAETVAKLEAVYRDLAQIDARAEVPA